MNVRIKEIPKECPFCHDIPIVTNNPYNGSCSQKETWLRLKECEDREERSQWISVEERLPEYTKRVIVCDVHDRNGYIGVWSLEKDPDDGSDCWEDNCGWWQPFDQVTHWMPLPDTEGLNDET